MTTDLLAGLNPRQKEAVEALRGPLLVVAGPGSGKTKVLTHRIAYMVEQGVARPRDVLAVTFTNKAAREMRDRLDKLMGEHAAAVTMGTFHALCTRILRREAAAAGLDPRFTIADDEDQARILKPICKQYGVDLDSNPIRQISSRISNWKADMVTPVEARNRMHPRDPVPMADIYAEYEKGLQKGSLLDFDDLLWRVVQLFETDDQVLAYYRQRFPHVLVNEFQDTNTVQYTIMHLLAAASRNVCIVGDTDQSVYSWRNAKPENIKQFVRDFAGARTVVLDQNYRSTKTIIGAADALIGHNPDRHPKKLWTANPDGAKIVARGLDGAESEATFIVSTVREITSSGRVKPGEIGVLYRTNSQSRALEKAFLQARLPHKVIGTRFYDRSEVKDVLAYLRVLRNPADWPSLDRVLGAFGTGIGEKTSELLLTWAADQGRSPLEALDAVAAGAGHPFPSRAANALTAFQRIFAVIRDGVPTTTLSETLRAITEKSGFKEKLLEKGGDEGRERWENVTELVSLAARMDHLPADQGFDAMLDEAALFAGADTYNTDANAVTLITFHAAKGLEFDAVFLAGMEDGLCPHGRALRQFRDEGVTTEMEEERRLLFVGITRARKFLWMTYSRYRQGREQQPSMFFDELPAHLLVRTQAPRQQGYGQGGGYGRRRDWDEDSQERAPRATNAGRWSPNRPSYGNGGGAYGRPTASAHGGAQARPTGNRPPVVPAGPPPTARPPAPSGSVLHAFRSGMAVLHPKFGRGTVVTSTGTTAEDTVTVAFPGVGVKPLLIGMARLTAG